MGKEVKGMPPQPKINTPMNPIRILKQAAQCCGEITVGMLKHGKGK